MLCLAAEMRGIETVEISHAFGIPEQGEGYTKKDFMAKNHRIKPKKIITFDDITYASIKKNSGIKTFLCEKLATPFSHKCKSKKNNKIFLVTCQWGYGGEDSRLSGILPNKIICEEILFLIKKYPSWQWYVKLHPVQLTGEFSKEYLKIAERVFADFKNVQWKSPSLLPLEKLLSNVGLHITMHSSSTFEALRAGIKTIALCPALRPGGFLSNYWENLCQDKVLFKINPKNLEQAINQHYGKQISSKIINKYFSKHAMSPTAILVA